MEGHSPGARRLDTHCDRLGFGLRSPDNARKDGGRPIRFHHTGRNIEVVHNDGHPSNYLWIIVDGARYFLGVLEKGETRAQVKTRAQSWLNERADVFRRG